MSRKIPKMIRLEKELQETQLQILQEWQEKTKNDAISNFLTAIELNQMDIPRLSHLLASIYEHKIYQLKIGSKIPSLFNDEICYYTSSDIQEGQLHVLFFEKDKNNNITNISYTTE